MKILLKIIIRSVLIVALLATGFAAGFPVGQRIGFATGSEWAIIQAEILAREAGVYMPVSFAEGQFRVSLRQPQNLHQRAWQLSERFDKEKKRTDFGEKEPLDLAKLTQ